MLFKDIRILAFLLFLEKPHINNKAYRSSAACGTTLLERFAKEEKLWCPDEVCLIILIRTYSNEPRPDTTKKTGESPTHALREQGTLRHRPLNSKLGWTKLRHRRGGHAPFPGTARRAQGQRPHP